MPAEKIRVTGVVQGVGFRPAVWRLAHQCGVTGDVLNDAEGVLIRAWGDRDALDLFCRRIRDEPPPLAHISDLIRSEFPGSRPAPRDFMISKSAGGQARTRVPADAATCKACLADIMDPDNHRYRYPFTNCTHCGPRLSIIKAIPYDRANTSMDAFTMCGGCRTEYEDPADRRFHAQPNACPRCGPTAWLEDASGQKIGFRGDSDPVEGAARLIRQGHIVAVKGIGGFHLACDAANEAAVARLRERKHRYAKPLAMMVPETAMVGHFAELSATSIQALEHRAAPVVVLPSGTDVGVQSLAPGIAPNQNTLGFMLPYTPLHHLLMLGMQRPVVMTSGNRSDEPQATENSDARERLQGIADYFLMHDRDIVNRLDDSVLRVIDGQARLLRRARGFAPQAIPFAGMTQFRDSAEPEAPGAILAMGGELKNTFCLLQHGEAVVSQHIGDMEQSVAVRDYSRNLALYRSLFQHQPQCVAVDRHPEYISTKMGFDLAGRSDLPVIQVQHHHAHIAGCMAEHQRTLDAPAVLGIALDGLGYGDDETFWGGEFLMADYRNYSRLARFHPVAMPGAAQAMREPWRNTWAHLCAAIGWSQVRERWPDLELTRFLESKPLKILQQMCEGGLNSPPASSCGRLFDAAAAAIGVCREQAAYEGQAATELEAMAAAAFEQEADFGYPVEIVSGELMTLAWGPLWNCVMDDLQMEVPAAKIAARFHHCVIDSVAGVAEMLSVKNRLETVVLSGGVFQNRLLLEGVASRLRADGLAVLAPTRFPANDGGLALGQAAVAAAQCSSDYGS